MRMRLCTLAFVAAATFGLATTANATIATVYDSNIAGATSFDNTVTSAGGVVSTQQLNLGQSAYTDFTLSKNPVGDYGSIVGSLTDIAPSGSGPGEGARASGVTLNFNSAINSFGFNVGDWGTCCDPSALYIAFDGGPGIQVGLYDGTNDTALTNGNYEIFVAAFDDSSSFSQVTFWGDGFGEVLYAGGTVRYALIDQGSLPSGIPEPATWAMMICGFGMAGASLRRRRTFARA
jgi:hypothetical protein